MTSGKQFRRCNSVVFGQVANPPAIVVVGIAVDCPALVWVANCLMKVPWTYLFGSRVIWVSFLKCMFPRALVDILPFPPYNYKSSVLLVPCLGSTTVERLSVRNLVKNSLPCTTNRP